MAEEQLSGMARDIRASVTSEQFDLGGYTEARAHDLMLSAFSTPLTAPTEMVRFTFVVGGGKLVRARYSDDLPKWVTSALRDIGFTEDRGAAETFDSQGTYKQQHDTGQNLKYVIVYPRVACASAAASQGGGQGAAEKIDTKSPEYIVSACDLEAFKKRVNNKTSSWRQCKRLLKVLQDNVERFKAIEAKLCAGAVLSPAEQTVYDSNSGADADKITWLQAEIKKYVDEGRVTSSEKQELLANMEANVATVNEKLAEAVAEGKPKKIEKLEEMKAGLVARKAAVEKVQPVPLRLKHGDEVQALRLQLLPLIALEEKGRSLSLTMDDLKKLKDKSDIEEEIAELEAASRGWFEEEEDFQARCAYEEKAAKTKYASKKASAAKGSWAGGQPSKTGGVSWATAGGGKKPAGSSGAGKKQGGVGFAAAFGADLDSD